MLSSSTVVTTEIGLLSALAFSSVLLLSICVGWMIPAIMRLCNPCRLQDLPENWYRRLDTRSYEDMNTLLGAEDFRFLSRQPGYDWRLYRKFRHERLRIFRQYLHRMIVDFNRLHLIARLSLAQSQEDHSKLLKDLVWLRIRFSISVLRVEFRWALSQAGIGAICARELINELEELRQICSATTAFA